MTCCRGCLTVAAWDGLTGAGRLAGTGFIPRYRLGNHAVPHPELGLPAHVHEEVLLQRLALPFARVGPDRPPPVLPRRPKLLLPEDPSLFRPADTPDTQYTQAGESDDGDD